MTARSDTQIANLALIRMGARTISDLSEDSEEARKLGMVSDVVIATEMRNYLWNFALARTSLPALGTTPAWGYKYEYQLPADYLRIVQINDIWLFPTVRDSSQDITAFYAIEGRKILTDLGTPLKIRYIRDMTADPSQWDASFISVAAFREAIETCVSLTGSIEKLQMMQKGYASELRMARRVGALEVPAEVVADGSWIDIRMY